MRLCKVAKCHYCLPRVCLSFCLLIRPSVRMEQLGSHWTDFREMLYLSIFRKPVEKIQVSLKSDKNNVRVLYMQNNIKFWSYLPQFFLELEMSQIEYVMKIKTQILCSIAFFFRKSCRLWDNVYNLVQLGKPQLTWRIRFACSYLRLQTHTENMQYLLLFHSNNGCTNAPQCYVICTVLVL